MGFRVSDIRLRKMLGSTCRDLQSWGGVAGGDHFGVELWVLSFGYKARGSRSDPYVFLPKSPELERPSVLASASEVPPARPSRPPRPREKREVGAWESWVPLAKAGIALAMEAPAGAAATIEGAQAVVEVVVVVVALLWHRLCCCCCAANRVGIIRSCTWQAVFSFVFDSQKSSSRELWEFAFRVE